MPGTARPHPRRVDADREWATRRNRAVAAHAADLARREAAEAARAAELLREFVAAARERGLAPVPLTARSYGGRGRYRTKVSVLRHVDGGWPLREFLYTLVTGQQAVRWRAVSRRSAR
jgi:hypothetical protein